MEIKTAQIVEILPTKIWIESGMLGERVVVMRHEGCNAFDYAVFNYDHQYTSNSTTWQAATNLALALGALEPIEHCQRAFKPETTEIKEIIRLRGEAGVLRALLGEVDKCLVSVLCKDEMGLIELAKLSDKIAVALKGAA